MMLGVSGNVGALVTRLIMPFAWDDVLLNVWRKARFKKGQELYHKTNKFQPRQGQHPPLVKPGAIPAAIFVVGRLATLTIYSGLTCVT